MNKLDLILIFVITALLISAFLPGFISPVQTASYTRTALSQAASIAPAEQSIVPGSPSIQIAITLTCLLFSALTFFPQFVQNNGKHANQQGIK